MDAMDEQQPPTKVCPTDGSTEDVAAAGGSAVVLVGVLCFVFAAAFVIERLIRTVVGVQTTARTSAQMTTGAVPVQTRLSPRVLAPPPHPSEERLSTNNAKLAAEVVSALERQAVEEESSESDDEIPVDIDELRQQVARRVSPDMRPATNPCSPRKRVTGGLRGFTNSRPLQFEAVFDRTTLRDPTDFWLAKFALTHREEFENLVAETETELPAFVQDPGAPLDLLRSDVGKLKSSLARMAMQQRKRDVPRAEHERVAPTPVKQPPEQHTSASASPPVSPVLNLDADDQIARKMPLVDSAGPAAFAQPAC
jgi:hypothetical protein